MDLGNSAKEPWADSPRNQADFDDDDSPPPKPRCPAPEASQRGWPTPRGENSNDGSARADRSDRGDRHRGSEDSGSRGTRVRGPAEVKTARNAEADDEDLPPGVQSADFKTLQSMIARGIQDAETGAVKLEKDIPPLGGEDEEERRWKERQRQRRDQEGRDRENEREKAKQKRRKEQEERERRMVEELEREEREEISLKEARSHAEVQCRRELAAAVRIQARVRGRISRTGIPCEIPRNTKAVLHWEPHMNEEQFS